MTQVVIPGHVLAEVVRQENLKWRENEQIARLKAQADAERAELDAQTEKLRARLSEKLTVFIDVKTVDEAVRNANRNYRPTFTRKSATWPS